MRPQLSGFGALTVAALVLALGSPAALNAQRSRGAGGSGDDGGGRSGGGDRGVAVPRGGDAGPRGGDAGPRGGDAGTRGGDPGGGRTSAGGTSSPRTTVETQDTTGDRAVPRRPREDRTATGRAVPRADVAPSNGGTVIIGGGRYYGGYYPWGYGGLGLGGYYGFYDPWYDPYYGGYYGNYYGNYYGRGFSGYEGHLRLKVKPSDAEVFVDGYYAGIVDEFDNLFQHLNVETGPHRIEIREDGYEPLTFEVRILPGRTVTYKGELKRNP